MMNIHAWSRKQLENNQLPGKSAIIRMTDPLLPFALIKDKDNCVESIDLWMHDVTSDTGGILIAPAEAHAKAIWDFTKKHMELGTSHLIAQCEAGLGRSQAVVAGITANLQGEYPRWLLNQGTYNRSLFTKIVEQVDGCLATEPLVAIVVRVKYPIDRLLAFLLSLKRQRYDNWKCIYVTDGPRPFAIDEIWRSLPDHRFYPYETAEPKGRWGHPYRQKGIDYALTFNPTFISLANDDNYLTPGFIEQMVNALGKEGELAICNYVNSYQGYGMMPANRPHPGNCDLCQFMARDTLIKKVKWEGDDFEADGRYLKSLSDKTEKIVYVRKPLVVKN